MMRYLAHSAGENYPAQWYSDHVQGVVKKAEIYAREVAVYAVNDSEQIIKIERKAASYHDLGKLDDSNQSVLGEKEGNARHLPVNHVDAGAAYLKQKQDGISSLLVYSHHRGLPDMAAESVRGNSIFRDKNVSVRDYVDVNLDKLLRRHHSLFSEISEKAEEYSGDQSLLFRMLLSCLADADHTDTAMASNQYTENEKIPLLQPEKRLEALNDYVGKFDVTGERNILRNQMYNECRDAKISESFVSCDSPVGSGKTTAVMAHLLEQAIDRGARRVFVILPYTNIITQSVDTYRKALVLPGEEPEEIVAEHHYKADFQSGDTRYLTALWRAPIVVTTAVAFFETLASNRPSTLRRLHEIPGSVIFMDEAHAALPVHLLPLAWKWMNVLAEEWSCYWVLASGSLVRFWEIPELTELRPKITELVQPYLRKRLMKYEQNRIMFRWNSTALNRNELVDLVMSKPGPRLLIMNTVQSAAVMANDISERYGKSFVEHMSTALLPDDRKNTIEKVKKRLKDKQDKNWVFVATSCAEAGVDFSFRTGFREIASLLSLLQTAGRVDRHGYYVDAEMWSFFMQDDNMIIKNGGVKNSASILKEYFEEGISISPELSTRSLADEVRRYDDVGDKIRRMLEEEETMNFKSVSEMFRVIETDTVPVIINADLAEKIKHGFGDWKQLQKQSVSLPRAQLKKWNVEEIANGIYFWKLPYDSFLGYMSGVLEQKSLEEGMLFG